jgi:hypothetical protein
VRGGRETPIEQWESGVVRCIGRESTNIRDCVCELENQWVRFRNVFRSEFGLKLRIGIGKRVG